MANELANKLIKMGMDEDNYEREDRLVMLQAAQLLGASQMKVLTAAYKEGFCDAIVKGTRGTNIHVTANNNANAFALSIMKGIRHLE